MKASGCCVCSPVTAEWITSHMTFACARGGDVNTDNGERKLSGHVIWTQTYSCEFNVRVTPGWGLKMQDADLVVVSYLVQKQVGYTGDQSEQATVQNPKPQITGTRSTSRQSTQAILRNPKEQSMVKHKETNTRKSWLAHSKLTNKTSGKEQRKTHT